MQVSVTGRHMDITDAIRSYAVGKVEHALAEFPRVLDVHVILQVEKYRHLAEVVVHAANHIRVDARQASEDMYGSIDGAVTKAARQLRRHRDKVQHHKAREKLANIELEVEASQGEEGEA